MDVYGSWVHAIWTGNRLGKLSDYLKEPGLNSLSKGFVLTALTVLLYHESDRRTEVLDFYRDLLSTYTEALSKGDEICVEPLQFQP